MTALRLPSTALQQHVLREWATAIGNGLAAMSRDAPSIEDLSLAVLAALQEKLTHRDIGPASHTKETYVVA